MKREKMLEELEKAADSLRLKVVTERLSKDAVPGGLCRVRGEYRVLIDRHATLDDRIGVLLDALARFSTEKIYVSPEVRDAIEQRAARVRSAQLPDAEGG